GIEELTAIAAGPHFAMQSDMFAIAAGILGRQPGGHAIEGQAAEAGINGEESVAATPRHQVALGSVDLFVTAEATKGPHIVMQRAVELPPMPVINDAVGADGIPGLTA